MNNNESIEQLRASLQRTGLESRLGFVMTSASYLMRKHVIWLLKNRGVDCGVTIEELPLMGRIFERPDILQTDLVALTLKDKTTVARLLSSLEKKGMINRTPDHQDRRARRIDLSERGTGFVHYAVPIIHQFFDQLTEDIPDEDLAVTLATVQKLYANIGRVIEDQ